jgi:prepilin-type N-terminal cleavage/methylation domain-containing protein/prepilin-type processing-associated H-X9-DG protein
MHLERNYYRRNSGEILNGKAMVDYRRKVTTHVKRGFTLIELLVVISVIALLIALLLPALQGARKQARAIVCRAHLKQWGTVLAFYAEENEGRIPRVSMKPWWLFRGSRLPDGDPNKPPVYHNLNTKGIACCPMAVRPSLTRAASHVTTRLWRIRYSHGSTFEAWEIASPSPPFRGSYGFNNSGSLDVYIPSTGRPRTVETYPVKNLASIPVILDSAEPSIEHFSTDGPPRPGTPSAANGALAFCINRHNGHVNGLFMDWSARRIGLKELWTLKWHEDYDTAGPWTKAGGIQPEDWPEWMRGFKDY